MTSPQCPACGWGGHIKPPCKTVEEVVVCNLNWENRRKYALRFKGHEKYAAVRSVRHQGVEGKGDSSELFETLTIEQLRDVMKDLVHLSPAGVDAGELSPTVLNSSVESKQA